MNKNELSLQFRRTYGRDAEVWIRAPGRVNIIGEHTDYTGGFALPAAVDRYVVAGIAAGESDRVRLFSRWYPGLYEATLSDWNIEEMASWTDYVRGAVAAVERQARDHGRRLLGFDLWLGGDLAPEMGMGSSGALVTAVSLALSRRFGIPAERGDIARMARDAENVGAGVPCGILDPAASVFGVRGKALHLDCAAETARPIPFPEDSLRLVVVHSGIRRRLTDSAYRIRREECRRGEKWVAEKFLGDPAASIEYPLREIFPPEFEHRSRDWNDTIRRRIRHVLEENVRVNQFAARLKEGHWRAAAYLLGESHASLRDNFEVCPREIDGLVTEVSRVDGVLGARLMGAGFGGSVLVLLEGEVRADLLDVLRAYRARTGFKPTATSVKIVEGAGELARAAPGR